jgi:hypothetical protein
MGSPVLKPDKIVYFSTGRGHVWLNKEGLESNEVSNNIEYNFCSAALAILLVPKL